MDPSCTPSIDVMQIAYCRHHNSKYCTSLFLTASYSFVVIGITLYVAVVRKNILQNMYTLGLFHGQFGIAIYQQNVSVFVKK